MVLSAGEGDEAASEKALSELCRVYWYPLYAYVRRRGYSAHDAEDLTQAFFLRLLEKRFLEGITAEGGRFRSFLLTALQRFVANEWDRERAQKRGGGIRPISLEGATPEERYLLEPVEYDTPEKLYDRRWALTLLENALARLESEFGRAGKSKIFEMLKPCITGEGSRSYAELASSLGLSEGAIKVTVHRMRERFRALMQEVVAETVSEPQEIEEEMRFLAQAVASGPRPTM
jgi:RNA polymerase sigma factor (sigma-70 family)